MAIADWEWSYNGFTFGGSQAHQVMSVAGLSPPDARVDEIERAGDHGSFIYSQFLGSRTITIEGDVTGTDFDDFQSKLDSLRDAFTPQSDSLPLSFALSPGGTRRRIYCKPTKVAFPIDANYNSMYEQWTVELMAEDPRIYSDVQNRIDLYPAVASGIGFNLAFSINFGGTTGGGLTQSVVNVGTFPTQPVVTFYGPIYGPSLKNLTTGESIDISLNIDPASALVVDFQARTVMLGKSSRYNSLLPTSTWWALQPGANTVRFSGDDISGNTRASVSYRDAWN